MDQNEIEDLISAALDGEPVDLSGLRAALHTAEGRELLASFVMIRATARAGDIEPSDEVPARLRGPVGSSRRGWWLGGPRIPASIAATLVTVAIAGTLFAGRVIRPAAPVEDARGATAGPATTVDPERAATGQSVAVPVPASGNRGPSIQSSGQPARRRGPARREPPKPARVLVFDGWRHGA
jgi:hypothetical protein